MKKLPLTATRMWTFLLGRTAPARRSFLPAGTAILLALFLAASGGLAMAGEEDAAAELFDPASFFLTPESDPAFPFEGEGEATISGKTYTFPFPKGVKTVVEQDEPDGQVTLDIDDADATISMLDCAEFVEGVEIESAKMFEYMKSRYADSANMEFDMQKMLDIMQSQGFKSSFAKAPEICQNTADTIAIFAPSRISIREKGEKVFWHLFVGVLHVQDSVLFFTAGSWNKAEDEARRRIMSCINKFMELNRDNEEESESP